MCLSIHAVYILAEFLPYSMYFRVYCKKASFCAVAMFSLWRHRQTVWRPIIFFCYTFYDVKRLLFLLLDFFFVVCCFVFFWVFFLLLLFLLLFLFLISCFSAFDNLIFNIGQYRDKSIISGTCFFRVCCENIFHNRFITIFADMRFFRDGERCNVVKWPP